jgi:hypothetical protein
MPNKPILQGQDVATLEAIARYAQELADAQREAETPTESDRDEDHTGKEGDALPEEVPTNASIVTKTINGYDYYYGNGEMVSTSNQSTKRQ